MTRRSPPEPAELPLAAPGASSGRGGLLLARGGTGFLVSAIGRAVVRWRTSTGCAPWSRKSNSESLCGVNVRGGGDYSGLRSATRPSVSGQIVTVGSTEIGVRRLFET